MSEIKPTSLSIEHVADAINCDCPACDANKKYEVEYDKYLQRKPYIIFSMTDIEENVIETWLNDNQKRGYEMTAAHNGLIIMRAVPPQPPTARDVITEVLRRQKEASDEIGPTIGPVQ